jgi:hypothetical protein
VPLDFLCPLALAFTLSRPFRQGGKESVYQGIADFINMVIMRPRRITLFNRGGFMVKATTAKKAGEYQAFATCKKAGRLKIHRAMAPARSPKYSCLLDIAYDGPYGTNFVLVYEFMIVLVRGKNLQKVIAAIQNDTADFIQECDPDLWKHPTDKNAPFIESVEVVIKGLETEMASATRH